MNDEGLQQISHAPGISPHLQITNHPSQKRISLGVRHAYKDDSVVPAK